MRNMKTKLTKRRTKTTERLYRRQYRILKRLHSSNVSRALNINLGAIDMEYKMNTAIQQRTYGTHPKSYCFQLPILNNKTFQKDILTILTPLHTHNFFSPSGMMITVNKPMNNPPTLSLDSNMVQRSYFGMNLLNGKVKGNFIERACYGTGSGAVSIGVLPR